MLQTPNNQPPNPCMLPPQGWDCLCPGDPMGDSPDVQEAFERFLEEAKYVIPPTDERQIVLDVITA